MRASLISIIIPAFNCESTIEETIYSVINQTIKNIEIIVINNNSTDNTLNKVIKISDNRIKIYNCKKQSPAAARNLGIKYSSSDIIAFIDADDIWFRNKLEKSLLALKKYDFVYHDLYIYKKKNFKFIYKGIAKTRLFSYPVKRDLILNGNGINTSSVVVKKSLLYKAGLFDENENLFAAEDYDLWIKISEYTESFKKIKETLGKYIITGNNITNHQRRYTYTKELNRKYNSYLKKEFNSDMVPWMAYNLVIYGFKQKDFSKYYSYFKKVKFFKQDLRKKLILTLIFLKYLLINLSNFLFILKDHISKKFR